MRECRGACEVRHENPCRRFPHFRLTTLCVADLVNGSDDNSIISLHPTRMEDLGFFNGSLFFHFFP